MDRPEVGRTYRDRKDPARRLEVREVVARDPDGRNVRGVLRHRRGGLALSDRDGRAYACDFAVFGKVWDPAPVG